MTIAGGGTVDGRPATSVAVFPFGVAVDVSGNLYIAERDLHRVRKVASATGLVTTLAGNGAPGWSGDGGPATSATLQLPSRVAVDKSGNVFIADSGNNWIRKIAVDTGIITRVAGNETSTFSGDGGPATAAGLVSASSVAVDATGNLFIADGNRVRRVAAATGVITTVAGTSSGGFSGDGGPASLASLAGPSDVCVDPGGNLLVADYANRRIRRIDARTGIIATVAGGGSGGDGGPATAAGFYYPSGVATDGAGNLFIVEHSRVRKVTAATGVITTVLSALNWPNGVAADGAGNLFVADTLNGRVLRVDGGTGATRTVAGGGALSGDGGPATSATLYVPWSVAVDGAAGILIADSRNHTIRRVDARTGSITTVVGTGVYGASGDGGPATAATLSYPKGIAVDGSGNLFIADPDSHRIRRVDATTGIITTVAGTGAYLWSGDGGPATATNVCYPEGVAVDGGGNLLIAETASSRIRRVDATTGIITTVAGTVAGFGGDGGPATEARLNRPSAVVVDGASNVYFADRLNNRIRRVDGQTGIITTVAGGDRGGFSGDGGTATSASLNSPYGLAVDAAGNLFVGDTSNQRVRKVAAGTGVIMTVAGSGESDFFGDGGPALAAGVVRPSGVAVDPSRNLYIAESGSNRVRAVSACAAVAPPPLVSPGQGATGIGSAHGLVWGPVPGAFRYDLYLDRTNPPSAVLAADLTGVSYAASNLLPGTTYHWKVVAKGDPYCPTVSTASSEVRSFTTAGGCSPPGAFALSAPSDGATGVATGSSLSWQPAAGAGSYNVYLGPSNPPELFAFGGTGTSVRAIGLVPGATYSWSVTALATCDPTKTTSSAVWSFRVAGGCSAPGAFTLQSPSNGATGIASNPTLSWSASPNASSYDVYLGTSSSPPLHVADVSRTSVQAQGLAAGATYSWKVVAKTSCDPTMTAATLVQTFTVAGVCNAPGAPTIAFVPPGSVAIGQTYVVAWWDAPGLDAGGGYLVERSTSSSFTPLVDSQATTSIFVSMVARAAGTYYHRVKAVPACDPTRVGPYSGARSVTVVPGAPNVVFTVQPTAVVSPLGEKIDENKKTSFTLENVGTASLTLQLTQQFLGPLAFFTIVDPLGGSVSGFTLEPRKPKAFEIRFQGADPGLSASYQGVVVVLQANYQPLAVAPFAFVNLKVGGFDTAVPSFELGGVPAEYAFFPGVAGDPAARTLTVDVVNAGDGPMDLGAEVGPEVWLVPQAGWNALPIPPHAKRPVTFTTDRSRAPNGSALPRYTYFTVRTKSGQTARLLVQDNDVALLGSGRTSPLGSGARSYVVPSVARAASKIGNVFVTKLRLSNVGSEAVQADLYFTPRDADGFSAEVRRATVVIPPNDVVTLTNPLVQLYGYPADASVSGQLEVQAAAERIGSLSVTSTVDAAAKAGGTFGFQMPTATRGEGARVGQPHTISGITFTPRYRTNLILAETTGVDHAVVRATLYDKDGSRRGDALLDVSRYGQKQVAVSDLGASDGLEAGQIELTAEDGGGAAVGLVTVIDNTNDDAVTYVGRPVPGASGAQAGAAFRAPRLAWATAAGTAKLVVPAVVNGYPTFRDSDQPFTFQSLMGFTSGTRDPATFRLSYTDLITGQTTQRTVTVPGRATREHQNVLEELFGVPKGQKSQGPVFVEADLNGTLYCKVFSVLASGSLGDSFPVIAVPADSLTGHSSAKPIYVDGLEQSVDLSRGTRSNLILNEVTGLGAAGVTVTLYEAGNRSTPIAEEEVTLAPGEKKQLSTVFTGVGLESATRNKDRANVLCVVTARSGTGLVSAVVTTIDNKTGDTKNSLLTPTGGVPATGTAWIGR